MEESRLSSSDYPNSGDDSDEDIITDYLMSGEQSRPSMACKHEGPGPLVPTISVTPHSPGAKQYPILEDNLQHLHEIHESIQQMRDQTAVQLLNSQILGLTQYVRLSASCPSLNNDGWDPELLALVNSSTNHNPSDVHFMPPGFVDISVEKGNSKDWHLQYSNGDITRRRSWTALEDLSKCREKRNSERQRSMSLSSLDSEQDDPYFYPMDDGGSTGLLVTDKTCHTVRGSGGASTHSLNEADLQNDFKKIVAKREADSLRLLPARLPLQKSVSTPSIIAVRDNGSEVVVDGTIPIIPPGTESETEEELLSAGSPKIQISLDEFLKDVAYGRDPVKRRKRGSIFFRRKKDKPKKVSHQWVSACYGSAHACDWCAKPLTNKPALYCENCTTTVHQNSCKDHIMDCNKPKLAKNTSKAVILPAPKQTSVRRGSGLQQGHTQNSSNRVINEEKEGDGSHHDGSNVSADEGLQDRYEFLGEDPITANDLETDPFLGLHQEEPDSWSPTVGKEVTKKLKDKEIKRQEHMYEFILTEKHHCLTLRVMQKVFVEGLQRHFQLGKDLERMFPRLFDLTEIHLNFLQRLRERQRTAPIVETISDILLEQFSGLGAQKIKSAYGEFCSRHRDAVDIYKSYLHDHRFSEFMRHCQCNPLLKKKGIPECILFVTQRLTKYPLLIEPLIKTSKDNKREQERLGKALLLVKEILTEVDAQVAEKEKEDRKLEIYNRIEAKSFTVHRGHKFKKSDILSKNRRLRFEGVAMLMQGRGKMQLVLVIVLSDVLFFLLENNHKYTFFTPDNKAGVVSLQKLLVREKAGQESRGIYLISSNPADPEMFELKVHKPKDKQAWIHAIRSAVHGCQEDEDEVTELSSEERQRLLQVKQSQIRQIVGVLRQKDMEQAQILEEKMALQQKLLAAAGVEHLLESPNYTSLVAEDTDSSVMWQEVLSTVQEVNSLASSLYAPGTNLSRSVSSVGEHQSEAYISPTLPKRAETFGGFDNANKEQLAAKGLVMKHWDQTGTPESESNPGSKTDVRSHELPIGHLPWHGGVMTTVPPGELPALLMLGQEQQLAAVQLSHYVYKLLSIISQQMTTIHSLQAQLSAYKSQRTHDDGKERRPVYRHNQQLEELRNLQDKLTQEKEAWQRERDTEEKYIEEKKAELQRLQEIIRAEQNDIIQQREQLYRKLEMLTSQGILISPNLPMILTHEESGGETSPGAGGDSTVSPTPTMDLRRKADLKWKSGPSKSSLPLNLISATNQQKVASNMQIKQQLPLKLATKLGTTAPAGSMQQMLPLKLSQGSEGRRSSGSNSGAGYQRLGSGSFSPPGNKRRGETLTSSHTRTGSSPAMMQNSSNSPSTGETPGGKSPESQPCTPCGPAPQASEEEVIFF